VLSTEAQIFRYFVGWWDRDGLCPPYKTIHNTRKFMVQYLSIYFAGLGLQPVRNVSWRLGNLKSSNYASIECTPIKS